MRCTIEVTASSLNVRDTPGSPLGKRLGYVSRDDVLISIDQSAHDGVMWHQLESGGWVHGGYVEIIDCDDDAPDPGDDDLPVPPPPPVEHWAQELAAASAALRKQGIEAIEQANVIDEWLETHELRLNVIREPFIRDIE